ncbi:hypothetical protein [Arthrobacter cryoconiti]|uniref:N-acetyltransferase domain-containing protein n=1 Tax=Arthrobacter cryoconiti TaxID=748907 RepID=A0ABV8R166_9MICC|nr:hypothetical protein [Arthrobacter cryoconiti]MCC9068577.1 hypothetical protein [Arthrobacter cryoconiti]
MIVDWIAEPAGNPLAEFPMPGTVSIQEEADPFDWDPYDLGSFDGQPDRVGIADFTIVPGPTGVQLGGSPDDMDEVLYNVAVMLALERPDLLAEILEKDGDLLVLSNVWIEPKYRGHQIGHRILAGILSLVGRGVAVVILKAAPNLDEDDPPEASPEHLPAKAALRRYWTHFGFPTAARDYMVYAVPR